jgi:HPr kinase/phosphorylase
VPHIRLPVRPGRNIATIIEIAARNQILRKRGVNSAQRYETALLAQLQVPEGG